MLNKIKNSADSAVISSHEIQSLNEISHALHLASQFIGAAGKCLIVPEADGSHTSMRWKAGWFIGKSLPSKQRLHVALDTDGMILLLIDEQDEIMSSFDLTSKTYEEGIQWLKVTLEIFAINVDDFKIEMEADIPDHPVRHGGSFPFFPPEDYQTFIKTRNLGSKVMQYFANKYRNASPVETWPHHFDIATHVPLLKEGEETTHAISLGMAIQDAYVDEHYFYITHWKKEGNINYEKLPELPSLGYWNRKDFTGAILKLSDVINHHAKPEDQWLSILTFMEAGITASVKLLGV